MIARTSRLLAGLCLIAAGLAGGIVRNGKVTGSGGGLLTTGVLTLDHTTWLNNTALLPPGADPRNFARGGGVASDQPRAQQPPVPSPLMLLNSTFSGNSAEGNG